MHAVGLDQVAVVDPGQPEPGLGVPAEVTLVGPQQQAAHRGQRRTSAMASRAELLRIDSPAMITSAATRRYHGVHRVAGGASQQGKIGQPGCADGARAGPPDSEHSRRYFPVSGDRAASAGTMGSVRHFDLCIIGIGSGNSIVDKRFADRTVALVEQGTFGGTCLNVGCIPTKMYVYPADLARAPATRRRLGVDLDLTAVRWADDPGPDLRPDRRDLRRAARPTASRARTSRCSPNRADFVGPTGPCGSAPARRSPRTGSCSPPAAGRWSPTCRGWSEVTVPHLRHGDAAGRSCPSR